ncbi:HAD superfamily hydrolase [Mycobacterium tuberculosis]|nr:HAD superfamily hydrolase [Mycobacterium tuberculosis]CMA07205.1 HAD superfamily hydrolase [Mycobacterium tuberculosis]
MTSRDGFTIVWDWNGTLCDDRTILLDAVGQTLVNEGFEPLSQQQLIQRFALNRPGMSGDSSSWKGWGHVRWFIEEVPAGAA